MRPTLTHIALHVPDLSACIDFYQRFCGMRVIHERAGKGSKVILETDGPDEQEAMDALLALIADYFGEGE